MHVLFAVAIADCDRTHDKPYVALHVLCDVGTSATSTTFPGVSSAADCDVYTIRCEALMTTLLTMTSTVT